VVDNCDFGRHLAPVREFTPKKGTLLFANMRERRMERIIRRVERIGAFEGVPNA